MATATLVPVEEYLRNSWSPDREYVDGVILERNLGELPHAWLETYLPRLFEARGLIAIVELRTQVKPQRFRVPDVLVIDELPQDDIVRTPPYIVIEILSPEDRASALTEKLDDYLDFGVPNVWVIDPSLRTMSAWTREGSHKFTTAAETSDGRVSIPLEEIFSSLSRLRRS
ncbi:MAG TPA: Uma2 family endonuclease [Bryobacteraceae bacterium]|jgi:Uma2 family endonuclease|nr:Uma2 family endonuclease [Bryobacteraceae bacterium]